jgi:uncharacterized protein
VIHYAAHCLERERGHQEDADQIRREILDYNEQDCRSTSALRDWLLTHLTHQPAPLQVRELDSPTEGRAAEEAVVAGPLWQLAGIDGRSHRSTPSRCWPAAVDFYRPEEKPFWWGHFDRLDNPPAT